MMAEWHRVRGDVKDTIVAQLGGIADLSTATDVIGIITQDGETFSQLDGSVSDAASSQVTISLAAWLPTAAEGDWWIEYEVTFGDGSSKTWPERGQDRIHVRAR